MGLEHRHAASNHVVPLKNALENALFRQKQDNAHVKIFLIDAIFILSIVIRAVGYRVNYIMIMIVEYNKDASEMPPLSLCEGFFEVLCHACKVFCVILESSRLLF